MDDDLYKKVFSINTGIDDPNKNNIANPELNGNNPIRFNMTLDIASLTMPKSEENVEDVRNNAPTWFKTGNRLITKKDYEYFIKSNRNDMFSGVIDAVCMNNWDYMTSFYRWLYNLGMNPCQYSQDQESNPYKYMQKARLVQSGYEYVDAADANNIYLWIATSDDGNILNLKS